MKIFDAVLHMNFEYNTIQLKFDNALLTKLRSAYRSMADIKNHKQTGRGKQTLLCPGLGPPQGCCWFHVAEDECSLDPLGLYAANYIISLKSHVRKLKV